MYWYYVSIYNIYCQDIALTCIIRMYYTIIHADALTLAGTYIHTSKFHCNGKYGVTGYAKLIKGITAPFHGWHLPVLAKRKSIHYTYILLAIP